jgi:hypothetical protein
MSIRFKKKLKLNTEFATQEELYQYKVNELIKKKESNLLKSEAKLGGKYFLSNIFSSSEFFCLDPSTWVLHETHVDEKSGKKKEYNIRFEIYENKILKFVNNQDPQVLTPLEFEEFSLAVQSYQAELVSSLYGQAVLS